MAAHPEMANHQMDPIQRERQRFIQNQEAILNLYELRFERRELTDGQSVVLLFDKGRPVEPRTGESLEKALKRHLWTQPKSVYRSGMALYKTLEMQQQY